MPRSLFWSPPWVGYPRSAPTIWPCPSS
jgi:hypothetical protein